MISYKLLKLAIFISSTVITMIILATYVFTDPGWLNTISWILISTSSTLGVNFFIEKGIMSSYLQHIEWDEYKTELQNESDRLEKEFLDEIYYNESLDNTARELLKSIIKNKDLIK